MVVKLLVSLLFTAYFAEAQAPVRLASNRGTSPSSNNAGRLEIFLNGQWGTVCDDSFGSSEATVACRQLGFDGYTAYGNVVQFRYSQPSVSVPILLDDLLCSSTQSGLEFCLHRGTGNHNCGHSEDVALVCFQSGSLRLDSSTSFFSSNVYRTNAGRLEIYINSEWGTVCRDLFGSSDANVACRQLGYSGASNYGTVGSLGYRSASTSDPIWLDNVQCTSSDLVLEECTYDPSTIDCTHSDDVAVVCSTSIITDSTFGNLRLVSNFGTTTGTSAGRLEIRVNGEWGTVCDDNFGSTDADVACRQLGYPGVRSRSNSFGNVGQLGYTAALSSVRIWMDEVGCSSSYSTLIECPFDTDTGDCRHSEDVAIVCSTITTAPVRLASNRGTSPSSNNAGRLEIFLNGQWGTVCDDSFGSSEATVACRQLGFDGYTAYGNVVQFRYSQPSVSVPILLDDLLCSSTQSGLEFCLHRGTGNHNCGHSEDVALVCFQSGSLRLDSSTSSFSSNVYRTNAGRLEIYINSEWGTVCRDLFGSSDANVACRQLGYSGASNYGTVGSFGYQNASSSDPIWLDNVQCTSSDLVLEECTYDPSTIDCTHSDDVAVVCSTSIITDSTFGNLRLVSNFGTTTGTSAGRLEIRVNGEWGTVCDDNFGSTDADVACRQLGYPGVRSRSNSFGNVGQLGYTAALSSVRIWMDEVGCSSSYSTLIECPFDTHTGDCRHFEDVAIACSTNTTVPSSSAPIRLVSNEGTGSLSNNNAGRLEIFLNGQWGTVCDDSFSLNDATVACRQLGYDGYIFYDTVGNVGYEQATSSVPIWLDDLACTSSDTAIETCSHRGIGVENCFHSEDVALSCYQRGSLRLVRSFSNYDTSSGRLEIYLNGEWGTVCDDSFGSTDANVACRQLGYSGVNSGSNSYGNVGQLGYTAASFNVPIWMDEVGCSSSDTSLIECPFDTHTGDCSHSEDVAIVCSTITVTWPTVPSSSAPLRLVSNEGTSSSSNNAGRLEIFLNDQWGTVCDDSFSLNDATVACRQLGYDGYIFYDTVGNVGYEQATSSVPIWLDDLACTSSDTAIETCSHRGIGVENCVHSEDVALSCYQRGSLRLVRSSSNYDTSSGRLEIYLNGEWGTVCDDFFGSTDATVACRQLGYSGVNSGSNSYGNVGQLGYTSASFRVPIWLDDLACFSTTTATLLECPYDSDTNDCSHSEDVALSCMEVLGSSFGGSSGSSTVSSGAVIGIVVGVLMPFGIVIAVVSYSCCARSRRRHRGTAPHVLTTNVQPATTTTVFTNQLQTAQDSTLPAREPYPGAYPTTPQQPPAPAPFAPKPDSVLYPQEAPPPYPASQFSTYPQQPPQAYPGTTTETGTAAPYPTNDPPAYPLPTNPGYPQAGAGPDDPGYPQAGAGGDPGYPPQASSGPSYPTQASSGPSYPPQASSGPSYPPQASSGPGYPPQTFSGPGYPLQATDDPAYPPQAGI